MLAKSNYTYVCKCAPAPTTLSAQDHYDCFALYILSDHGRIILLLTLAWEQDLETCATLTTSVHGFSVRTVNISNVRCQNISICAVLGEKQHDDDWSRPGASSTAPGQQQGIITQSPGSAVFWFLSGLICFTNAFKMVQSTLLQHTIWSCKLYTAHQMYPATIMIVITAACLHVGCIPRFRPTLGAWRHKFHSFTGVYISIGFYFLHGMRYKGTATHTEHQQCHNRSHRQETRLWD